jgi:hypothetical protein
MFGERDAERRFLPTQQCRAEIHTILPVVTPGVSSRVNFSVARQVPIASPPNKNSRSVSMATELTCLLCDSIILVMVHCLTFRECTLVFKSLVVIIFTVLHATEATGGKRYSSYSLSTSELHGGEWSASRLGRALAPGKGPHGNRWTGGWVNHRACLDTEARGKIIYLCRG